LTHTAYSVLTLEVVGVAAGDSEPTRLRIVPNGDEELGGGRTVV
jgi:hypothetical protein